MARFEVEREPVSLSEQILRPAVAKEAASPAEGLNASVAPPLERAETAHTVDDRFVLRRGPQRHD